MNLKLPFLNNKSIYENGTVFNVEQPQGIF